MTNKYEGFYSYMGKFFGSRIVQTETKDRIYDDNNKTWYVNVDRHNKVYAFASVHDGVIKNIYSSHNSYLKELLLELQKQFLIKPSIVPKIYEQVYIDSGLKVENIDNYKHFIMIRGEND